MRIVGGQYGGRRLVMPKDARVRPTADRVPWLADGLVDAAFRIETNEWNGTSTLQARLCALSPHTPLSP